MKILPFVVVALFAGLTVASCGPKDPPGAGKPSLQLDNLTPEQKIEKVKNDPHIPEEYKQTYINSIKAQQGQGSK